MFGSNGYGGFDIIYAHKIIGSQFDDHIDEFDHVLGGGAYHVFDGGPGADFMAGAAGNDIYYVDNVGDAVIELEYEGGPAWTGGVEFPPTDYGVDTVYSSINYQAPGGVEILILQGIGDLQASGNHLQNTVIGNNGSNVLDGGGDADVLTGGSGSDTFVLHANEAQGDTITDFAGNGAAAGDSLQFIGFGTSAQGATLTQLDSTRWQIHSGLDGHNEIITLSNSPNMDTTDYFFI
jgi:Ca2+-binding RTX toxin-like protein